jgi:sterol desaturase/sphingolipid hydroxylase (fatty acid hydroxylase superfamily)
MSDVLNYLLHLPTTVLWLIFFAENLLITILVLLFGNVRSYTSREWMICGLTNILNTVVTYVGFRMWERGFIVITTDISWMVIVDFLILFFTMDLLMFIFHYIIHKTFLFKTVHQLHHQSIDPTPIDLFILHPVEAIGFGSLWLFLLVLCPFNIYAVMIYLTVNVIFGLAGHLEIEPLPEKIRNLPLLRYLGTSTFHHHHHQHLHYNFGFYTSIWDRLFGTHHP